MRLDRISCLALSCVALSLFAGCVSNTYEVRRSALVPSLTPPMRSGRPIDGRVQVAADVSTNLMAPEAEANGSSGMYVARTTIGTAARFRVGRAFDIGPTFQVGIGDGAMPAGPDLPPPPSGNALGTGVSMQLAPRLEDQRFGLAAVLDVLFFSVPIREEWWCLDCGGAPVMDRVERESDLVPVFGLALLPSYQPNPDVTFFGGLTIRNQPYLRRSEVVTTTVSGSGDDDSNEVDTGSIRATVSLGAEAHLGGGARVILQASQPATQDPVQYGPSIAAGLTWTTGEPAPR